MTQNVRVTAGTLLDTRWPASFIRFPWRVTSAPERNHAAAVRSVRRKGAEGRTGHVLDSRSHPPIEKWLRRSEARERAVRRSSLVMPLYRVAPSTAGSREDQLTP